MKCNLIGLAFSTTCLMAPGLAQADPSFNLGVVSLYKSNGVDQDNPEGKSLRPALQGGVDFAFENGFYLGNWNSTGRFGKANVEVDLYGGHRGQLSADVAYDVGLVAFIYPDSGGGWNGNEAYGSLSWGPVTVKYARGVSGAIDKFARLSLAYTRPITDRWQLQAGVGVRNQAAGRFNDYSLGVTHEMGEGLSAQATFSGTSRKEQLGGAGDNRLVLGLVKGF